MKKQQPKRPRPSIGVKNALSRVGEIVKIAVQHPSAACLVVMTGCAIARNVIIAGSKKEDLYWQSDGAYWSSHDQKADATMNNLSGLYGSAQNIALAAALAPVASAGLGVLGAALTPKKGAQ